MCKNRASSDGRMQLPDKVLLMSKAGQLGGALHALNGKHESCSAQVNIF